MATSFCSKSIGPKIRYNFAGKRQLDHYVRRSGYGLCVSFRILSRGPLISALDGLAFSFFALQDF